MFGFQVEARSHIPTSRNTRFNRFFSSPAGSEFAGHIGTHTITNKHKDELTLDTDDTEEHVINSTDKLHSPVSNGIVEQDAPHNHIFSGTPLDEYLFANNDGNTGVDAIAQEHDAYVEVLLAAHKQETQALKKLLDEADMARHNSPKSQELQREVEHSLSAMREEIEGLVRAEVTEERKKDKQTMETHFKDAMVREVETITKAIKEETQVQMHAQLQSMRAQIEAQVRTEMRSETEHKVRLALVQQMRPQVRAELEQALRLEIRTVYGQEIRKEVEATIVPEIEKRIAAEYKAKHTRNQSAQKEHMEAELQAQLTASKKALEDRVRRDTEATIARKVGKKVEGEVRMRVDKMKQEVHAECEAEAKKLVEVSLAQIKQERAEVARLRAVENVRRTREEASHKEAEADFHRKVAEFKRYMQEEESRLARMKAVVQWRDEHPRRSPSSPAAQLHASAPLNLHDQHVTPNSSMGSSSFVPTPKSLNSNAATSVPSTTMPMMSTMIPTVTAPTVSSNPPGTIPPSSMPLSFNSTPLNPPSLHSPSLDPPSLNFPSLDSQSPESHGSTPGKPAAGLAFDFTFDVKLIAAKLISDAREHTHDSLTGESTDPGNQHTFPSPSITASSVISHSQNSTPVKAASLLSSTRSPSPVRSQSPAQSSALTPTVPGYTLGPISTEQRAQREFETQPPIVPPQGTIGARLRVLLPRLYQLWDECELSHIHRLDFSNGLRAVDVAQAERRVAMEIARLRRVLPTIHEEMAMVTRREAIKARLAQESQHQGNLLAPAEKAALLAELRRVTCAAQAAISAWEAANSQPFMYRGFPYLALMYG